MDELEKSKQKLVELLKIINNAEELKERKDELLDMVEELFTAALNIIQEFLKTAASMDPEKVEEQMAKFQDDDFIFNEEINAEMERIGDLQTDDDEAFIQELEARMGPQMEKIAEEMGKFMEKFMGEMMGGLMEGLTEGMSEAFGEMTEGDSEEYMEGEYEDDEYEDEGRCEDLLWIYNIDSLEKFKEEKDSIIDYFVSGYEITIEELQMMKDEKEHSGDIGARLDMLNKKAKDYVKEMAIEFERIGSMEGGAEFAEEFRADFEKKAVPLADRIDKLVEEIRASL